MCMVSPCSQFIFTDITCTIKYDSTCKTEEVSVSLEAGASVDSLVSALCRKLKLIISPNDIDVYLMEVGQRLAIEGFL